MIMNKNQVPASDIEHARSIRKYRGGLKKDLKKEKISLEELLAKKEIYDIYIANMNVFDIVLSLPGYGRVKAEKIMKELKINSCKKFKGLGKKQRKSLSDFFGFEIGAYV